MKSITILSTTVEHRIDAERLATILLERKLIACAQISGPITSIYRWEGKINRAEEFTLNVKTTPAAGKTVLQVLRENHPYELPEIVGTETSLTDSLYLDWVHTEVQYD